MIRGHAKSSTLDILYHCHIDLFLFTVLRLSNLR